MGAGAGHCHPAPICRRRTEKRELGEYWQRPPRFVARQQVGLCSPTQLARAVSGRFTRRTHELRDAGQGTDTHRCTFGFEVFFRKCEYCCNWGKHAMPTSGPSAAPLAAATPSLLWSTNTYLKFYIQKLFQADRHYVWCSTVFDGGALPRYALGAGQAASSDPASIYRALHHAVKTSDGGNEKIRDQKKTLRGLAVKWTKDGSITTAGREEIFSMLKLSQITDFRPLIYVIPYPAVAGRLRWCRENNGQAIIPSTSLRTWTQASSTLSSRSHALRSLAHS